MKIKYFADKLRIFFPVVIGSMVGAGIAGLIESIVKTLAVNYGRWTLPFDALGYYAVLGIVIGVVLSVGLIILFLIFPNRLDDRRLFAISTVVSSLLEGFIILAGDILNLYHINKYSDTGFIATSVLTIIYFVIIFFLAGLIYYWARKLYHKPLLVITIAYLCLFGIAGVISILSPKYGNLIKPYNEQSSSQLKGNPNVILIIMDSLREDRLSPYGYNINTTTIQGLADDGILYTNCFANSNCTRPATASIFTSLLPFSHGAIGPFNPIPENLPIIADEFTNHGYYAIGFCANPTMVGMGFSRGFNEFYHLKPPRDIPMDEEAPDLRLRFASTLLETFLPGLIGKRLAYCNAEKTTDKVINWLKINEEKKFFIYIHYMDPHGPYYKHPYNGIRIDPRDNPADSSEVGIKTSLYREEIVYNDEQLGRLINLLKKQGIYDSCMIILTADHGEEFFDHYGWFHGNSLFEEQIHIPLIIKLPNSERAGEIDSSLVSQLDFAPTMLNVAGFSPPDSWDGENIFDPDFGHSCVIAQHMLNHKNIYSVRTLKYKWIKSDPGYSKNRLQGLLDYQIGDKRAVFPPKLLYDMVNDPHEKHNLYGNQKYQPVIDELFKLKAATMANMAKQVAPTDSVSIDEKTLQQLKELGYLQ